MHEVWWQNLSGSIEKELNKFHTIKENSFGKVTSWPQLISKLLVTHACLQCWPHTFLHPECSVLFSISLLFVNKYNYFVEAYKQMLL